MCFRAGGSCFASAIASDANVFWRPHHLPHVLSATACRVAGRLNGDELDIFALPCRVAVLLVGDGFQHVLFTDGHKSLQLIVSGAGIFEPVRLTSRILWPSAETKQRLEAIAVLNALRQTGRFLPRFFRVEPRCARLRWVLRALDGFLAGASHREIGVTLFGIARIERDWADPGDHLRDMIRRAVKRGRSLMDGEYRRFLS